MRTRAGLVPSAVRHTMELEAVDGLAGGWVACATELIAKYLLQQPKHNKARPKNFLCKEVTQMQKQAHGLSGQALGRETGNPLWVDVQHRTFTAWVNQALSRRAVIIRNLPEGLENGVNLCFLLEELSGASLGKKYDVE